MTKNREARRVFVAGDSHAKIFSHRAFEVAFPDVFLSLVQSVV